MREPGGLDLHHRPDGGMPTITTVPPRRTRPSASSTAAVAPAATRAQSTPRPSVSSRTARVASSAGRIDRCAWRRRRWRPRAGRREVDGDDRPGTGQHRSLDAVEPDASGADHGHAVACCQPARVDDGAVAGDDAAGQQAGAVERQLARDGAPPGSGGRAPPRRTPAVRRPWTISAPAAARSGLRSSSAKRVAQSAGWPRRQTWQAPQERTSVTTT